MATNNVLGLFLYGANSYFYVWITNTFLNTSAMLVKKHQLSAL